MQEKVCVGVFREGRSHGADYCQIVDMFGDVGEKLADRHATFTMVLEFPGAGKRCADIVELRWFNLHPKGLAMVRREAWFGIPAIHLGRSTIHVQIDHVLDFRGEVGRPAGRPPPGLVLLAARSIADIGACYGGSMDVLGMF